MIRTIFFLILATNLIGQRPNTDLTQPPFTPAVERLQSMEKRKALIENSLVKNVPFRSVGPTIFGGRVSELAVNPDNPNEFYAAYASSGLWYTKNNGQTFEPLFQNEVVMTIGAIDVDWKTNTIWLGTGEVNSSRSSYAGVGMFKSTDGGKTWAHKGLHESHHIGRIVVQPNDPKTITVAVLGHLYSPNQERGIYKTTDGGNSWKKVLFINQNTGVVDLIQHPTDPNILYAAAWERERRAWNFVEGGNGTGIYKSMDGGDNWELLTTEKSDFPTGKNIGRIGINMALNAEGNEVIYAILDNQNRRPKEKKKEDKLVKKDFEKMSKSDFLNLKNKDLNQFLKENKFPKKYTAKSIKKLIENNELKPIALFEYLENANSLLFETEVIGTEVYVSKDGGKTWKKTHDGYLEQVTFSYGYYFGMIRVNPSKSDEIYIAGVPVLKSKDGGKTFENINGKNVHVDHHDIWVNPKLDGHLILANDGGVNISYDDGENWYKVVGPPAGQFYSVSVDDAKPYNIYGGTQDNGVWKGPSTHKESARWQMIGKYPYQSLMGGDGMQTAIDSRDNTTVYTGFQFGYYFRIDTKTGKREAVTPKHKLGERPLRWNWQTPIHLSKHNEDILYMGSNKLYRSMNQGNDWTAISDDLTTGGRKGDVPYGTLSSIHESDLQFGLIYTGSDDGKVYVTKDGGVDWEDISIGLPEKMWVARIQASTHEKSRVYLALNGYRWDNFRTLIYVSENYGKTWLKIGKGLPPETANVLKEDPLNPDLLYLGTDHGLYISLDRGESFMALKEGLPAVPVHDVVVQKRENELVVGTHGRSIFVADISPIQMLVDSVTSKELYVYDLEKTRHSKNWGGGSHWFKRDPVELKIPFYSSVNQSVTISVKAGDTILKSWNHSAEKGINYSSYDLTFDKKKKPSYEKWLKGKSKTKEKIEIKEGKLDKRFYLMPGKYVVEILGGGKTSKKEFLVE